MTTDRPTIFDREREYIRTLEAERDQAREDARVLARLHGLSRNVPNFITMGCDPETAMKAYNDAHREAVESGVFERNKP